MRRKSSRSSLIDTQKLETDTMKARETDLREAALASMPGFELDAAENISNQRVATVKLVKT
jgi:hypothetical protein